MIKILVDSSADYTMEEIEKNNFYFVPINVSLAGKDYQDVVNLKPDLFYDLLISTGEFPKTSQPSPQDFLTVFEAAKGNGEELICILLSSALSGTCQSAHLAKNMVEYDKIHIIDSLGATGMIKMMGNYARKLISEGYPAEEIVKKVEALKGKIRIIATLDTLEYLQKGGRLSRASATIGKLANIKPIVTVNDEGEVAIAGKCIGKNKALNFMMKYLEEHEQNKDFPIYTIYSHSTENTEKLEERLIKDGYMAEERMHLGSTIGAHVGPGVFAYVYVEK